MLKQPNESGFKSVSGTFVNGCKNCWHTTVWFVQQGQSSEELANYFRESETFSWDWLEALYLNLCLRVPRKASLASADSMNGKRIHHDIIKSYLSQFMFPFTGGTIPHIASP